MQILDLSAEDDRRCDEAAALLLDGFAHSGSTAWNTRAAARREVDESLEDGRISRVAVDDAGVVVGWIGGISTYDGHAWELHPLVVRRDKRGQGIGRALVHDLEQQVAQCGGVTIYLGTDDENGRTSLAGRDVYPDVLAALRDLRNTGDHPFTFYQQVGFVVVGVIPDANGWGKPDILMAKRVTGGRSSPS
jgi:GNAT superfamily N-acetyltransferase